MSVDKSIKEIELALTSLLRCFQKTEAWMDFVYSYALTLTLSVVDQREPEVRCKPISEKESTIN